MKGIEQPSDICAHLGDDYDRYLGAIIPPLFQNTLFTRKNQDYGYSYSRITNPTVEILERKLAALENAEAAKAFSSGMGAITATISSIVSQGDHVIALKSAYLPVGGFLRDEMSKFGVQVDFAEDFSIAELETLCKPNTKLLYFESPSSNIFKVLNLREITDFARQRQITTVIDNTWATPLYQNPLAMNVDYVVHSATKYLGGHSDILGGAVMGSKEALDKMQNSQRASWGACMDPFAAWLLIRSLRTLEVRMQRHSENAKKTAEFLENHPRIKKVYYPGLPSHENHQLAKSQMKGFSGLMSFVMDTPVENVLKFVKSLNVFEEGPSWGGFESVVNTPGLASPEIRALEGVPQGLVRISVGLESADSILSDLDSALNALSQK